jgi:hypothetical protein
VRRARSVRGKVTAWLVGLVLVLYIFAAAVNYDPRAGLPLKARVRLTRSALLGEQQQRHPTRGLEQGARGTVLHARGRC